MNKIKITLEDLFNIPSAVIYNPDVYKPVGAVTIDSRNIPANSLFVAIKGEKYDGHDFVKTAAASGASAVIINEKKYKLFSDLSLPVITVNDTTLALGNLAKIWRKKFNGKVIGITGSAGKTTTKEIMAQILSEKVKVNKTLSNNNNHIGVPLTIFSTNNRHDILVLELGTNHFGEIEYTSDIAQPDYALITNIGSSHLEFLKNRKGVLKEKISLFKITEKNKGFIFINNDDLLLKNYKEKFSKTITYGFNGNPDVKGKVIEFNEEGKPVVEIKYKNKLLKTTFPLYGGQSAENLVAASAVAFKLGLTKKEILSGINKLKAVDKRLNVKKFKNALLIDDTYNANPESIKYALDLLGRIKVYKKKVAVLGDMFELGSNAVKFHKQLAPYLKRNKINALYTVGKNMKALNAEIKNSGIINKHFPNREELIRFITEIKLENSAILVKGSRGMKMEILVKVIEMKLNSQIN